MYKRQEFNIKSAEFYAESPKLITFELRNSNGVVLDDTTHFVSAGNQTLQLNFEVPISNDLQLGLSSGNSGLFRNDQGASYPYNIGTVMSITGSSASQPGYYYFYYNLEMRASSSPTEMEIGSPQQRQRAQQERPLCRT